MAECKDCRKQYDKVDLSRKGLCFECAKSRMIRALWLMWSKSKRRN